MFSQHAFLFSLLLLIVSVVAVSSLGPDIDNKLALQQQPSMQPTFTPTQLPTCVSDFRPKEYRQVAFSSISGKFFVRVCQHAQLISLFLQDRENKHEWMAEVTDVNDHAPQGVVLPVEFVTSLLKKAFKSAGSDSLVVLGPDSPVVDAEITNDGVKLTLTACFSPKFCPEFSFQLTPVDVDRVAVLEALLRDAQDEITRLREERGLYFVVSTKDESFLRKNEYLFMAWSGAAPRRLSNVVMISPDNSTLTIQRAGLYHIGVRTEEQFTLRVNDVEIAAAAGIGGTMEVNELLELRQSDTLKVAFVGGSVFARTSYWRFWGRFLSDL